MNEEDKEVNRKTWWVIGFILLTLVIGVASYYIWFQQQMMKEMEEMFAIEKESLIDEFEAISLQYEGVNNYILSNDSLFAELVTTKAQVQGLIEEIKTLKSTHASQINVYKKEAESLRKISRNLLIQIDSLDSENRKLKDDNKQITQKFQQASSQATRLTQQNNELTERVQRAARLDVGNIQLTPINNKSKAVKIDKAVQLMLTFNIQKNPNAPVGEQTLYIRLMKPDDNVLKKSNHGFFQFENKEIAYSIMKTIEYDGEEQSIPLYWDIEETLSPGTYRVAIFAAGNQIGNKSFKL